MAISRKEVAPNAKSNETTPETTSLKLSKMMHGYKSTIIRWLTDQDKMLIKPDSKHLDLPLVQPNLQDIYIEAGINFSTATHDWELSPHDVKTELKFRQAKREYEKIRERVKTQRIIRELEDEMFYTTQDFENGISIHWELEKIKREIDSNREFLKNAPPTIKQYFEYLKAKNDENLESVLDNRINNIFVFSIFANVFSLTARNLFGYFPFPHFDKLSDVFSYLHEPALGELIIKVASNTPIHMLNKLYLNKRELEIFTYKSFTRQDMLASMTLYGGALILFESMLLSLPALQNLEKKNPWQVSLTTGDISDVGSYGIGLLAKMGVDKKVIEQFPSHRFQDMETAVAIKIAKLEKQGKIDPMSLQKIDSPERITKEMAHTYKFLIREIHKELLDKSSDVRDYSKHDQASKKAYDELLFIYSLALSRRWLIDKLNSINYELETPILTKLEKKFDHYRKTTIHKTLEYRKTL